MQKAPTGEAEEEGEVEVQAENTSSAEIPTSQYIWPERDVT